VIRNLITLLLFSALFGCASARISFQSTPDKVDVFVGRLGDRDLKGIGQTPITVTNSELSKNYGGSGPLIVEYRKQGYVSTRALITDLSANDLTVALEMTEGHDGVAGTTSSVDQEKLNLAIDTVFESQRLARVGRRDDALAKLKTLENDYPYLSSIYEIEGGIYYLQKKLKESYDAYSLAVRYHPINPESRRMRDLLESMLNKNAQQASQSTPAPSANSTPDAAAPTAPASVAPNPTGGTP